LYRFRQGFDGGDGGIAGPQLQDAAEVVVAVEDVGELGYRLRGGPTVPVEPQRFVLNAVEQPAAQGGFDLFVPGFGCPAPLVFRLLEQPDVRIGLDGVEATLDQVAVVGG
jgi:hypothetical protein